MSKQTTDGKWLTTQQVADLIGTVTAKTVTKWCEEEILPAIKIRKRWYIHKERFLKMLDQLEWPYKTQKPS